MENLTKEELEFCSTALNAYWNQNHADLQKQHLGDIEKDLYEDSKTKSKALMLKIEKILYT